MVNNRVTSHDIINGIGAGLSLLDRNFRIIWTNKYQSDWFGTPQEILGKHCYNIYQHRQHICPRCPTLKVFKTGKIQKSNGYTVGFTRDGRKHYYQLTVSPIKDDQNKVVFALELVQDVTAKVTLEKKRIKIIRKLKHIQQHFSLVNKKLLFNIHRLKDITHHLRRLKSLLESKYHRKVNELIKLKNELEDIFRVNRTLSSSIDFERIFSLITRYTCELMHTDTCVLRLLDKEKKDLVLRSTFSMTPVYIHKMSVLKWGEGISGRVAKSRRAVVIEDINKNPRIKYKELIKKEGIRSILAVPILFQNHVLGVLSTASRRRRKFSSEDIEVLKIFASQVAIAIQESKHYENIHKNYFDTIHALVLVIETRDPYTRGHTERVTKYALEIARAIKMPQIQIEILRYAGEVHDVGKIGIPDCILSKPGKLTPVERAMVELHPVKGVEMLEPLHFLRLALPAVRHHHERYDGTGYPDGLKKDKIPLMSRILACADAFDAMTSERPYRRRSLTVEEALDEIRNNAGSQFDPDIAHSFIKVIHHKATNHTLVEALQ